MKVQERYFFAKLTGRLGSIILLIQAGIAFLQWAFTALLGGGYYYWPMMGVDLPAVATDAVASYSESAMKISEISSGMMGGTLAPDMMPYYPYQMIQLFQQFATIVMIVLAIGVAITLLLQYQRALKKVTAWHQWLPLSVAVIALAVGAWPVGILLGVSGSLLGYERFEQKQNSANDVGDIVN